MAEAGGRRDLTYIFSASALLGGFFKIRARTVGAHPLCSFEFQNKPKANQCWTHMEEG